MHTISEKLAKREKRARFPHERARKIFWSRFGVYSQVAAEPKTKSTDFKHDFACWLLMSAPKLIITVPSPDAQGWADLIKGHDSCTALHYGHYYNISPAHKAHNDEHKCFNQYTMHIPKVINNWMVKFIWYYKVRRDVNNISWPLEKREHLCEL